MLAAKKALGMFAAIAPAAKATGSHGCRPSLSSSRPARFAPRLARPIIAQPEGVLDVVSTRVGPGWPWCIVQVEGVLLAYASPCRMALG